MISNCYRDFGSRRGTKPDNMYVIGVLFGVINGGSRFLWGWLMDKFGFKILMFIITGIESLDNEQKENIINLLNKFFTKGDEKILLLCNNSSFIYF